MHRLLFRAACASVVAVGLLAPSAQAQACKLPELTPRVVDPLLQAADASPPRLPALLSPSIATGALSKEQATGCDAEEASCNNVATFDLAALATDDMTPPEKIGYRLSLETGTLPPGLTLPTDAVEPNSGRHIIIAWPGPLPERVADFTLRVVAVDAAGNESAPQLVSFKTIDVGCEAAADPRAGIALLAWLFAARRRRRSGARSAGSFGGEVPVPVALDEHDR
jgi:hypothetical protein